MASSVRSVVAVALLATCSNALCFPSVASTPALPLSEVNNALPAPTGPVKFVALGLGFQNYTCSDDGTYVQSVVSAGAIASLYDITSTINLSPGDTATSSTLRAFETCLDLSGCTPSTNNNFCATCHDMAAAVYLPNNFGEHFFDQVDGAQMPNFNLWGAGMFLSAKKQSSCKAPSYAYDGQNGLGAVAWLHLVDNVASDKTHGSLSNVYRVQTAGGVAPSTCSTADSVLQIPYAAEYWFY